MDSTTSRNGLTAMTLLYLTILINLWVCQEPTILTEYWRPFHSSTSTWVLFQWHSHKYTTLSSMFASLFTHADWEHVMSNMVVLWWAGTQLFAAKDPNHSGAGGLRQDRGRTATMTMASRQAWTHPLAFLWIYFGSHVLSVVGCRALSHWLDWSWRRQLVDHRAQWTWNWVPDPWKDAYSTIVLHPQQAVDLRIWQYAPTIGASAAVFGVVGAHLFVAAFVPDHPATMDVRSLFVWIGTIVTELSLTPFSLERVTQLGLWNSGDGVDEYDTIDHASHLFGFLGGFLLAAIWERFSKRHIRRRQQQNLDNPYRDV